MSPVNIWPLSPRLFVLLLLQLLPLFSPSSSSPPPQQESFVYSASDECNSLDAAALPPPDAQFVYRGEDVVQDSFLPWMAFVMGPAICTATIVSRQWVLSAGHCVHAGGGKAYPPETVTIFAGSANLSAASQFAVERIVLRSEYTDRYDEYIGSVTNGDMALIKLAVPLNFTESLRPICLSREGASPSSEKEMAKDIKEVVVAGWGNTKPHCETSTIWRLTHSKIPERLQFGRERILPMKECIELEYKWHFAQLAKKNVTAIRDGLPLSSSNWTVRELRRRITAKMSDKICVISDKEPRAVVESGDSGGPLLVSMGKGRWNQLGTLTGGPCHGKEAPLHDYYTQIDCDWIGIQTDDEVKCR